MSDDSQQPIVVKKIKKGGAGGHGGAWKIAYADFVTAMMAFFLLMWLINTTTPEQKRGIADYFAPELAAGWPVRARVKHAEAVLLTCPEVRRRCDDRVRTRSSGRSQSCRVLDRRSATRR